VTALDAGFFDRSVHTVARDLIGCELLVDGIGGVIVETESYERDDPACHAYVGLTARTATIFGPPGRAYVYLSYGIHSLLNFVTEPAGSASAVLVRALEPTDGIDLMRERRDQEKVEQLCSGPGKLSEALGVDLSLNGADLLAPPFELTERGADWWAEITASPRIGITKAADLPWRYCVANSRFVSRPWPASASSAVGRAA
jgi:DNA-3-methyladenine glycosylase